MIYKVKPLILIEFIISALASVFFVVLFIREFLQDKQATYFWTIIILYGFLFIISLIPCFLSLTYIIEDLGKTIQFDEANQQLIIRKGKKTTTVNRKEIIAAYKVYVGRYTTSRFRFSWYKYALIIIKERRQLFITNLICKPDDLLSFLNIKYKEINWNIPVISRSIGSEFLTSSEFDDKVKEFEENYRDFSKEQLEEILKNGQDYNEYARKAASITLEKLK